MNAERIGSRIRADARGGGPRNSRRPATAGASVLEGSKLTHTRPHAACQLFLGHSAWTRKLAPHFEAGRPVAETLPACLKVSATRPGPHSGTRRTAEVSTGLSYLGYAYAPATTVTFEVYLSVRDSSTCDTAKSRFRMCTSSKPPTNVCLAWAHTSHTSFCARNY